LLLLGRDKWGEVKGRIRRMKVRIGMGNEHSLSVTT
jgi:hypothetical protein